MSQASEDTSGFLDISPYPNSINSNDPIDTVLFQQQQQQQSKPGTPFPTTPYSPYSQPSGSNELSQVEGCEDKELQITNDNSNGNNINGDGEHRQIHSECRQGMVKEKKERIIRKTEQVIQYQHQHQHPSPSSPFIITTPTPTSTTLVKPTKKEEEEEESNWRFHCSCGIDKENYDDGMPMVQCSDCKAWSHIACAKYEEKRGGNYRCTFCRRKKKR